MKKYIAVLFVCLWQANLHAQEQTVLNVVYDFTYTRDLADTAHRYKAEMVLSTGKTSSRYTTREAFNRNSPSAVRLNKQREAAANSGGGGAAIAVAGGPMLTVSNAGTMINEEIFLDKAKSTICTAGRIGFKNYHYIVSIPTINWKLSNDKKEISGYSCQKAVGEYGGRTFEAWFAPDLPYAVGPWKLNGLPGLILSATDTKNEIAFVCKEITKNSDPEELVTPYMNIGRSVEVKAKEYQKVAGMFATDPAAIVEAQLPGTPVMVRNLDSPEDKNMKKIGKYNPMELK
ncbi:MAG: hypothetical protein DI535_26145 [Citrobacter freundii]|nr:MAG: hypothetical protein DI535_26145 [Citrobacter freundii]